MEKMNGKLVIVFLCITIISQGIGLSTASSPDILQTNETTGSFLNSSVSPDLIDMKTIGAIGGISWASSLVYYRLLNEKVHERLGGDHSADILLYSIEFEKFSEQERLGEKGNWSQLQQTMVDAAKRLKNGGADFIIICSNTMHSTASDVSKASGLPILHIADATGRKIQEDNLTTVALLGTKYTMEQGFYEDILENDYNLTVITPNESERDLINTIIFDELCNNVIFDDSKKKYLEIINRLIDEGAQGIILGCTEIPLLIQQDDVSVPVYNTMTIHTEAAVDYALNNSSMPGILKYYE